ncbi:chorismate mutase [Mycena filopes]|nr:chorismate mutase [Mycena filopes]
MQSQNFMIVDDPLSLDRIRGVLTRLEDTIIFSLIERAQFAHNPRIYQPGAFSELTATGFEGSWLEWFLKETETFHAKARRYTSPDEYPFTSNLPDPILRPLQFPDILHSNSINVNRAIMAFYIKTIVPRITRGATMALATWKRANGITDESEVEDDRHCNYGSAATIDVEALQHISKRVHYGKFVSESKFQENPAAFIPHIQSRNRAILEGLITKPEVEKRLLLRLKKKAETYAQDFATDGQFKRDANGNGDAYSKIDVDGVVDLYESFIIPLTKEVEVDYLLQRLSGLSEAEIETLKQRNVVR